MNSIIGNRREHHFYYSFLDTNRYCKHSLDTSPLLNKN